MSATAEANAVAIAASTTLPPPARISAPTAAAIGCCADTTPRVASTGGSPARAVRSSSAERIDQRSSLQASDDQRRVQTFGTYTRALADTVATPYTMPSEDLTHAHVDGRGLFALIRQHVERPQQLHRTKIVRVGGDHWARGIAGAAADAVDRKSVV